jgi:hypothetical protein
MQKITATDSDSGVSFVRNIACSPVHLRRKSAEEAMHLLAFQLFLPKTGAIPNP